MPRPMIEMVLMAIACAIVAAVLMWRYRAYIQALTERRPGESFLEAFQRGEKEHTLNQHAVETMMGGRLFTLLASIAAVLLTGFSLIWALQGRWFGYVGGLYLAIGLVVSSRLNLRKHRQWARLGPIARQELRLAHAWLWPAHLASYRLSGRARVTSANGSNDVVDTEGKS